jgi:transposase
MTDINILALFGIDITELDAYEQVDSGGGWVAFRIRKAKADLPCPACGSFGCHVKDYAAKSYRFRSQTGIGVRVLFEHRRLRCPSCGKAFFEPNPFMRKGAKVLSKEKILEIIQYLKDGIPSTLVAKYSFVSEATVSRVIDKVVKAKRRRLSRVVSVDEFCSFNSAAETKYACMVLDAERRVVIDVLPSRRKPWLDDWFSKIPDGERLSVEYVNMDMHRPYRDAFRKWCPNAVVAIDPFHYVRYVVDAIESARIAAMGRFLETEPEYRLLKKHRRLLLSKASPDSFAKPIRAAALGREMYASDIVAEMLSLDESLAEAYELGHTFLAKLDRLDFGSFKPFLQLTIERFLGSSIKEFREVGETFSNWREEICNSYIEVPGFGRLNNSLSEGFNNKVKTLKKACYGLSNFEHLRKRIFLIFDKSDPRK